MPNVRLFINNVAIIVIDLNVFMNGMNQPVPVT